MFQSQSGLVASTVNSAIRSSSCQKTARLATACFKSQQHALVFNLQRRNFALQNFLNSQMNRPRYGFVSPSQRAFFGKSKKEETPDKTEEQAAETEQKVDDKQPDDAVKQEASEEDAAQKEEGKEPSEKKAAEKSSSSSSGESSDSEDVNLGKEDIKRIKKLFNEQEEDISRLEAEVKSLEKQMKEKKAEEEKFAKEMKLIRIEYTKQVKENEETVKRYRKMIEDEKLFAITKFAKDLLEVRDAVRLALENTDLEAVKKEEDLDALKSKFEGNIEGQVMTAEVMDKVLGRFNVSQYDPAGDKFDPKLHEAVFTVAQSEQENDTVAIVMQTGWKINERILRAAKVGIVKK